MRTFYALHIDGHIVRLGAFETMEDCMEEHPDDIVWYFDEQSGFELIADMANAMAPLKTSKEWVEIIDDGVKIMDPDGWDRQNYDYSFNQEKISEGEFLYRRSLSTCMFS